MNNSNRRKKKIFNDIITKIRVDTPYEKEYSINSKEVIISKANDLIENNEEVDMFAKKVMKRYQDFFVNKYKKEANDKQSKFAYDCTRLFDSNLIESKPVIIPAKAGFGKSTFIITYLEARVNKITNGRDWGAIIVSDRIKDLEELQSTLRKEFGYYNENYKTDWIYVMKSYSQKDNEEKTNSIKVSEQMKRQIFSPILAISNIRLFNYSAKNDTLKNLSYWKNKDNEKINRELMLIDEKPQLEINDEISTVDIDILIKNAKTNIKDVKKRDLVEKELVKAKLELVKLEYKNIEQRNELLINNEETVFSHEFKKIWNEFYINNDKHKIDIIESLLKQGGLWCKTYSRNYFKLCSYSNINWSCFKTFIFDATGETDPSYSKDFNYLDINDYKEYSHLKFHNIMNANLSKSSLSANYSVLNVIAKWIKDELAPKGNVFVVTYKEYSNYVTELLKDNENIVFDKDKEGNNIISYFGNTKGKNLYKDCNYMVQLGWNRYPSDEYLASFISVYANWKELKKKYNENDEDFKSLVKDTLMIDNKGRFEDNRVYFHQLCKMASELEQEAFRTKVRNFETDENVGIYCFNMDGKLGDMLEQRLNGCKVINEELLNLDI
ncbi:MAG: hypothetical protein FH761_08440 [Firmicutes bacterium]|nr:hypothetical protein [Bacillota bacterium]